jgi:hypothetical protein
MMGANLRAVRRAGIPIVMGTDAGNPLTLHGPAAFAEMETMQRDGMPPMEVLVASTRPAARAMGREKDLGTIEKGKSADLVIVAADPSRDVANLRQLRWVMRSGVARSSDELRATVAKTRGSAATDSRRHARDAVRAQGRAVTPPTPSLADRLMRDHIPRRTCPVEAWAAAREPRRRHVRVERPDCVWLGPPRWHGREPGLDVGTVWPRARGHRARGPAPHTR